MYVNNSSVSQPFFPAMTSCGRNVVERNTSSNALTNVMRFLRGSIVPT